MSAIHGFPAKVYYVSYPWWVRWLQRFRSWVSRQVYRIEIRTVRFTDAP